MKISEYIRHLENVMSEIGDVEVQSNGYDGRHNACQPCVAFALILRGRESRPRFWSKYEGEERKGEAVCKV